MSLVLACGPAGSLGAADFEETALYTFESQCDAGMPPDCDPVGDGETGTFTHLTGDWHMQRGFWEGVFISYSQDSPSESWSFNFAADGNVEISPGLYSNANDGSSPDFPYLDISANGFGCSSTAGWFDVHEMTYDWWGKPVSISLDFEQSCNGMPPLVGALTFSAGGTGPTSFTPGNVLVSNEDVLLEYTPAGVLVQTIYVLESDGTEPPTNAGDLVLDAFGTLHLYNGNANPDPVLSSFSPATGTWEHHAFLDWDGANNGLATTGSYVFASDRKFFNEPAEANGIVRFDLASGFAAQRFAEGSDYRDVAIGLDGLVYGSNQNGLSTTVGIYDPDTLAHLGTLTLDEPVRGLAVNALGQIFGAGDEIYRFNPDGSVADSIAPGGFALLFDIDLDRSGNIVASAGDENVFLTTESLSSITSFTIANFNDLNVAWVQEPPVLELQRADFESGTTDDWDATSGSYSSLLEVTAGAAANGSFGLSVAVGTSCSDDIDHVVPGPTATGLHRGCNSVTAGALQVIDPGATFAAGELVSLGNDFSVAANTDLTAVLDPGFQSRLGYGEDVLPEPTGSFGAEFGLNLDALLLDPGDSIDHLVGYASSGIEEFRATLIRHAGPPEENRLVLAARRDDGTYAETPFGEQILLNPGWRTLRFTWKSGETGYFLVSVDGLPSVGLTGLDNDTRTVSKTRWGAAGGTVGMSTSGTLHMDDFRSWK